MDNTQSHQETGKVITQLTAAVQNVCIYPHDHPQILSHLREAHRSLEALLQTKREVVIMLIGDHLMADNRPLTISAAFEAAFAKIMKRASIEIITFLRGLPLHEVEALIRKLAAPASSSIRSSRNIKIGILRLKGENQGEDIEGPDVDLSDADPATTHDLGLPSPERSIRDIYQNVIDHNSVNWENVDQIVFCFMENMRRAMNPLRLMSEIKSNDEYTYSHTANVGLLTMFFAEELGFQGADLNRIGVAAILHDVGKLAIPAEILSKPTLLTPDERAVVETHPIRGAMRLMETSGVDNLAALAAIEHHINFDGGGYPRLKRGSDTNIVSQMIAVADVFDALRTNRPYREPLPQDQIIQIMTREGGATLNPYLVERFLNLIEKSSR